MPVDAPKMPLQPLQLVDRLLVSLNNPADRFQNLRSGAAAQLCSCLIEGREEITWGRAKHGGNVGQAGSWYPIGPGLELLNLLEGEPDRTPQI